jgi:signal peptidase II
MSRKGNVLVFALILLLDQVTKLVACAHLVEGVPVRVIPRIFNLTLVYNPGAAFGMFSRLADPWRHIMLIAVSVVAIVVVIWFIFNEARGDRLAQIALSGILAGAVGNIIDRFRFDGVIDFLDFYVSAYHWPAFNVADSAISIGVVLLIYRFVFRPKTPLSS